MLSEKINYLPASPEVWPKTGPGSAATCPALFDERLGRNIVNKPRAGKKEQIL